MIESHFTDIELHIIQELMLANKNIFVAVAWLTNPNLLRILTFKKRAGLQVEIIINDDDNNKTLNFDDFLECGGALHLVSMNDAIMHNKFCVIDENVVIHGSYNWTRKAEINEEQISICRNEPSEVLKYLNQFEKLKEIDGQRNLSCDVSDIIVPYRISRLHGELSLNQQKLIMAVVKFLQPQIGLLADKRRNKFRMSAALAKSDNNIVALDIPFELIQKERIRHDSFKTVSKSLAYTDIRYPMEEGRGITVLSDSNVFPKVNYGMIKGVPTTIKVYINARAMDKLFSLDKEYVKISPQLPELFKKKRSLQTYLFLKYSLKERNVIVRYNNMCKLFGIETNVIIPFGKFKRDYVDIVKDEFDTLLSQGLLDFSFNYSPIYPDNKDRGIPNEIKFELIS